jgi:hypothetical protein
MPNNLTGSKAKLTYQELLHVSDGIDGTLKTVYDGDGTALPIKVSNNQVSVTSTSSSDAFKITQTGTGNAFVVEDSASPDSTAFVIDTNGNVINGSTVAIGVKNYANNVIIPRTQLHGLTLALGTLAPTVWSSTASNSPGLVFSKSLGTSVGSYTLVTNNSALGAISFAGADGAEFQTGASILASVDNTAGIGSMPTRLTFNTSASGSAVPTERMRIDSNGSIGIGSTSLAGYKVRIDGNLTGGTVYRVLQASGTIQSDVTTEAIGFRSIIGTQATSFVLPSLKHFSAEQGTIGAGSSVTNQYGFFANGLTLATNNYGFFSNISSGTNRWNFYAGGTADNYFAGSVGIGGLPFSGANLLVSKNISGAVSASSIYNFSTVQSDVTSVASGYNSVLGTQAASFTLTNLNHYSASQGTFGAGSTITTQFGFIAQSTLIGASSNIGFGSFIPSGSGRWNFYAGGSADNYFNGNFFRGTVNVAQAVNSNAAIAITNTGTTSASSGYAGILNSTTAAISATVYLGKQNSATATDNSTAVTAGHYLGRISFVGSDTTALVEGASLRGIADGTWSTTSRPTYLHFNTTPNASITPNEVMRLGADGTFFKYQPDPSAQNTAATLTVAQLASGIITTAPAAAIALTWPTGTNTEAISSNLPVNESFEVTIINTSASAVTMTANTGFTNVGSATVAATSSASYRIRKTAANTFVAYRL